ncbi:hypothetical protein K450DRAFT_254240 [Umbelopsis ramanniana AG]|uniref:Uncharacterized protein n=1 Tax=Umbelopsis ramanniana AG TaxID=1314678 RepID=A0AAD5E3Y8_UMBRA|nr:uncharacterized protein K450DRAFT_254240 [Umbelopsis ramanniana AG]KAI8576921.1 hypothetical protein K450DRAFT_254240 [Umbelopsis ramanniana AG]
MATFKHRASSGKIAGVEPPAPEKPQPTSVFDSKTYTPYIIYLSTSLLLTVIIYVAAFWNTQWSDLFNSHPARGEMGLGKFIIKGVRFDEAGVRTAFAYPWRLATTTSAARISTWLGYAVHQLGQFYILANVQWLSRTGQIKAKWSSQYQWWNWQMLYLNVAMVLYKCIQGHIWYEGLAVDVPEGTAMGAVIAILIGAIIIEIPYRGLFFGRCKRLPVPHFNDVITFAKRYHGYMISFGIVYDFHYHPMEATVGHLGGFFYQFLLFWQSTSFLHYSHRNKNWTLLLEVWVLIHGTITALSQPGVGWQIFLFGFSVIFLVNQIWGIPAIRKLSVRSRTITITAAYAAFIALAYYGFRENKAYYRMTFIPVTEFAFAIVVILMGSATAAIVKRLQNIWVIGSLIASVYMLADGFMIYTLALILSGGVVTVYNDY